MQACHLVTGSSDPQSVVPSGAYPAPVAVPAGGGQRGSVRAAELQRGPVSCGALLRALRCVRGLEQVRRVWCPWVPQRLGPSTQRSRLAGGAGLSWWGWATPPCSELFCKAGSSMLLFPPGGLTDCPDGAHAPVTTAVLAPRRPWPPADGAAARWLDHDVPQFRSARVPAPGVAGGHLVQALLPGHGEHPGRGRVRPARGLASCRRRVVARQAGGGIRGPHVQPGELWGLPARRNTALP